MTHFLCLPLVTPDSKPQLEASIQTFRDAVATKEPGADSEIEQKSAEGNETGETGETIVPGIHPKAIRPVGALHCTLGVMSLDQAKLRQAVEALEALDVRRMLETNRNEPVEGGGDHTALPEMGAEEGKTDNAPSSLKRQVSPPLVNRSTAAPLKADLKGLVSMHAPHKTSILYATPTDASERLYPFCVAVQKLFAEKGFLVPDDRQLKLHATIVNTIYAKGRKQRRPPPKWKQLRRQETPEPGHDQDTLAQDAEEPAGKNAAAQSADDAKKDQGDKPEDQGDRSSGHGSSANAPLKIDATAILERFRDFVWAENVVLDRIAICEMGAKKILDSEGRVVGEEYKEVGRVKLAGVDESRR